MKASLTALAVALAQTAAAFPPAPHHEVYGLLRGQTGTPLSNGATVRLSGPLGPVASAPVDPGAGVGVNYSLKIPMDAGTVATLYQANALFPAQPFTVQVIVGGTSYVPIEAHGTQFTIGQPAGRTRLDLTLGIDSDGDGLPDAWEQELIDLTAADSLADVTPDGDNDGDGVSNYLEYLAGTYAFSGQAVFRLDVISISGGFARVRFLAVKGRAYSFSASADNRSFAPTPFSFAPDGTTPRDAFRAERTRFEEAYLPTGGKPATFYRLRVD